MSLMAPGVQKSLVSVNTLCAFSMCAGIEGRPQLLLPATARTRHRSFQEGQKLPKHDPAYDGACTFRTCRRLGVLPSGLNIIKCLPGEVGRDKISVAHLNDAIHGHKNHHQLIHAAFLLRILVAQASSYPSSSWFRNVACSTINAHDR